MKDLSIIIVSWNVKHYLGNCLNSLGANLAQLPGRDVETILVDNCSSDGTIPFIQQNFPWVRTIENKKNMGFAYANNQGIAESSGRYLILLNPDTELQSGAVDSLLGFMASNPTAGAAGSRLLNPDKSLQISCYPFPTLSRELWFLLHLDWFHKYALYPMQNWPVDEAQPVDVIQGAALIVRRDVIERIGLFDTSYFMYSEEVDLCRRIKAMGWENYWVPRSQVIHYGGQSTKQAATSMFIQLYKGKLLYFRKFYTRPSATLYKYILLFISLIRLLLSPLALLMRPPVRQNYLVLASRYARLIKELPRM